MSTATQDRPSAPLPQRRRRALRWVLIATLAVALLVPFVRYERGQNQDRVMRNEVRAAFTDIADPRWACGWGDDDRTWSLGCDLHGGGEFAPAVTFEAFDAPVDLQSTLSAERSEHLERVAQDHSGYQSRLTLLETRAWVPDAGGEVWGHVSRWQVDYNQPDAGYPVYSEVLRYADRPFGVTVYARSLEELDDVVASLTLPDPGGLPD
jgi:hypothetical protein